MNHKDSHWSQCQIADLPGLLVVDCPMEEHRIQGDWRLSENFGSFCVCHPFFGVHVLRHLTWPMFFLHSCPLPSIWWKDCPICLTELQPGENARDPSWFNGGWSPIWYLHFFHKHYLNGTKRYQPPSFSKTTWNYKAHKLPKIQWFKTSLTNFINWSNLNYNFPTPRQTHIVWLVIITLNIPTTWFVWGPLRLPELNDIWCIPNISTLAYISSKFPSTLDGRSNHH